MNERQEIKNQLRAYLPKTRGPLKYGSTQKRLDVVVTTYSYFSSEKSDDRSFLRKFEWDYMVVDEAHCLKNPTGARYKNMDAFTTKRRILLTGTPVQNSPKELMSLLCFLMPLFTRQVTSFDENDSRNDGGARMLEHFVRLEAIDKNSEHFGEEQVYKKLKQLLAPFVLRRLKSEVLAQWLPSKIRHVEWVPFDAKSKMIYDSIMVNHLQSRSDGGSSESTHVFTCLRKAANHGLLLRTRFKSHEDEEHLSNALYSMGYFGRDESCTLDLVKKELSNFSDYDIHCAVSTLIEENNFRKHELGRYLLQEEDIFCSPKFCRLREILPKLIDEGHRMLIFSQWTSILDLLECLMHAMNLRFMRLDGQTSIQERQTLIDEFSNDLSIPVFLLSTRAGGMGLNLTAADTCILHDLDFNPFNDIQAEDRIHRIGQKKPVTVIKMITEGTVDADIFKMQERKTAMNAAILENKGTVNKKEDDAAMSAILAMAVTRYNKDSDKNFSP
jgi:SWI/SNF-related matrix-associated actin-dependent regulator 1 of chromatin subfamily A